MFLKADDNETLKERLRRRGSETQESFERRVAELEEELADMPNNDYIVENRRDQLDATVAEIEAIIAAERLNPARPAAQLVD